MMRAAVSPVVTLLEKGPMVIGVSSVGSCQYMAVDDAQVVVEAGGHGDGAERDEDEALLLRGGCEDEEWRRRSRL